MNDKTGIIQAISTGTVKGQKKTPQNKALFIENFGIKGDCHAEKSSLRQVSLLMSEEIKAFNSPNFTPSYGDFGENIATRDINLNKLKIGTKIKLGKNVILEITQIGKICHKGCTISKITGKCIMPKKGIFARVLHGGVVFQGEKITII